MTPYSLHRLIMGKLIIDIFSGINGDICNLFLQEKFIEKSSTVHTFFVQIAKFIWLPGQLDGNSVIVIRHVYRLRAYNF